MDVKIVWKWCGEFTAGSTEIHEQRNRRPSTADERVMKIEQTTWEGWEISLDSLSILVSEVFWSTIHRTLTEKQQYQNVCARWKVQNGYHECWRKTTNGNELILPANFFIAIQGKGRLYVFYCHGWLNLGVPLYTWDQATITWLEASFFTQAVKIYI